MKVLHVIDSLSLGGAEKMLVESLPIFKEKNIFVDIALLNSRVTVLYEEVVNMGENRIYNLNKKSVYNPISIFKLIPILRRYDIVHVHLFPAQYYVVISKILSFSKCKLIFTEHSTSNRRLQNKKLRFIEKLVYFFYDKVVCITPEVKLELETKLKISEYKLAIIENGVNLKNIQKSIVSSRDSFGYTNEDKLILMVAGFRREKDQDTLIRCISLLPDRYKLILVGDGERREQLELLIESLKLRDRIKLLGIRNDVYSLMKMVDVVVVSSHWEGFGLVAVEAMGVGKPVIASQVKGLDQVVSGGGVLFKKGNEIDLMDKILKLEDDEYYQLISKACVGKAERYSINNTVSKLINLYGKI